MQKYQRVTLKDRINIQAGLQAGMNQMEIAKSVGVHKSTISRELKRHKILGLYQASVAEERARENFIHCRKSFKLQGELLVFVLKKLKIGWSPEQLQKRLSQEGSNYSVSYQTIYRSIDRLGLKKTHLHFGYKRRGFGRTKTQERSRKGRWKLSIHARPIAANKRVELGHWERDTIFDQKRKSVLILTDRKSRFTLLARNPNLRSTEVAKRTNQVLQKYEYKTITNDNGSEFFDIKTLKVPTYFCDVLKPGQRGTVENTIGLLRRFMNRKSDFTKLTSQKLTALQNQINLRPRKCLDYKTPYEVFYNKKVALAL